jgi:hypothetical protein
VGTATMAGTHKAQEGLDETIEQPCSDFLAHTSKVCKGADQYNKYSAFQG